MKYKFLKYFLILTIPFLTYLSFTGTGIITYSPIIEAFFIIPFLEFFLKPNDKNFSDAEEEMIKDDKMYDYILYLSIPIVYVLLWIFLNSMQDQTLTFYDRLGRILSMGLICGSFGINIGHELGHRNNIFEQSLSKILLLSSLYMHFFIEHNRGHHKNVSTRDDPSSARYGEMIFIFWLRSIITGYISAWKLELKRLKRFNKNILSINNEMLLFQLIQISFLLIIIYFFGFQITGYYLITALLGVLVLETVNYIEHYGLERKININGKYERIMPYHSWNSNHPMGRIMLFELSRHSDHHFNSLRKYQILKNHENSPEMPTGYPGMMILSLFPPLWFYVMHKKIRSFIT
jgi:alkane 1-monooxygenase